MFRLNKWVLPFNIQFLVSPYPGTMHWHSAGPDASCNTILNTPKLLCSFSTLYSAQPDWSDHPIFIQSTAAIELTHFYIRPTCLRRHLNTDQVIITTPNAYIALSADRKASETNIRPPESHVLAFRSPNIGPGTWIHRLPCIIRRTSAPTS